MCSLSQFSHFCNIIDRRTNSPRMEIENTSKYIIDTIQFAYTFDITFRRVEKGVDKSHDL